MDVRTQPGDVYELDPDRILIYGSRGIELRLNRRNMANVKRAIVSGEEIKDSDDKDRRFLVRYDHGAKVFYFDPVKGESVTVPKWLLVEDERIAA